MHFHNGVVAKDAIQSYFNKKGDLLTSKMSLIFWGKFLKHPYLSTFLKRVFGIIINCTKLYKNGFDSVPKCQQVEITLDCLYLSKYLHFLIQLMFMEQKTSTAWVCFP